MYLHLDLDVLDPGEARMSPYAATGGLARADVAWAVRAIARCAGITVGALAAAMVEAAGEHKATRRP